MKLRTGYPAVLIFYLLAATSIASPASAKEDAGGLIGIGEYVVAGSSASDDTIAFECSAIAYPNAAAVMISECSLWMGDALVKQASAGSNPGPIRVQADIAQVPSVTGALRVCWDAAAFFTDGTSASTQGCNPTD